MKPRSPTDKFHYVECDKCGDRGFTGTEEHHATVMLSKRLHEQKNPGHTLKVVEPLETSANLEKPEHE